MHEIEVLSSIHLDGVQHVSTMTQIHEGNFHAIYSSFMGLFKILPPDPTHF